MTSTSVIIPAYNSEQSVATSIESALSQSHPAYEIIVIDDGSTDRTADVVKSYGDSVRLIQQANAGQGAARNTGLKAASGRYIAFLDADDYWEPLFIERMERFLERHPSAISVSCAFHIQRAKGDYFGPAHHETLRHDHPEGLMLDNFFEFWARHDHVRTGTVLFRREAVESVGLQNPDLRISQDLEYWALLGTEGAWGLLPELLWVGTSDAIARKTGWRHKYKARRRRTPSIADWQTRVLPRLKPEQVVPFEQVRGRVAAGYMINHALGGDPDKGRRLLREYGGDMPDGRSRRVLELADRLGKPGWLVACLLLRAYEHMKK